MTVPLLNRPRVKLEGGPLAMRMKLTAATTGEALSLRSFRSFYICGEVGGPLLCNIVAAPIAMLMEAEPFFTLCHQSNSELVSFGRAYSRLPEDLRLKALAAMSDTHAAMIEVEAFLKDHPEEIIKAENRWKSAE